WRQTRTGLIVSANKSVNHSTEESADNCSVIARRTSPKHLSSSGSVASASSERLSVMLALTSSEARSREAASSASSAWMRERNSVRSSSCESVSGERPLLYNSHLLLDLRDHRRA